MVSHRASCPSRRSKQNGPAMNGRLRPSHCHCAVDSAPSFELGEPSDLNSRLGEGAIRCCLGSGLHGSERPIQGGATLQSPRQPLDDLVDSRERLSEAPMPYGDPALAIRFELPFSDKVLNRGTVLG